LPAIAGADKFVEHSTIHSAYIEESNYARSRSNGPGAAWGQERDRIREHVSGALEGALKNAGKAFYGEGFETEGLKRVDLNQPRAPQGSENDGKWISDQQSVRAGRA
jgi:hypothetical protein